MKTKTTLAYVTGVIATIGAIVLVAIGHAVPSQLWLLAGAGVGGGLMGSIPGTATSSTKLSTGHTATISSATIPLPPAAPKAPAPPTSVSVTS